MKFPLFFLFLFLCGIANATDYYVSTSGNNSNNGTSSSTPWQTLSKVESVCNSGSILPGDRILFKKGDSFTGKFVIANIWGDNAKSGTAANPITFGSYGTGAKPVFQYPQGGSTTAENRILMWFVGVDYYVIDGLNFTDLVNPVNDKKTPANCGVPIYLGVSGEAFSDHFTIQNVEISLCGMGIVLVGNFNKVINSSLTNFKNLKSTPNTGGSTAYEDYGANAFTIMGSDNEISNNYVSGAWAESLDFGWNGGACEMFNTCNRNKLIYNTFYDCGGISEFGADEGSSVAQDNLFAYNKIVNCGTLTYCNISGVFAIQVSNNQYFNNVIIENNASRFSGPNTGVGITTPSALALIVPESELFSYNGSPTAPVVFNLKNNIFNLSTGIDVIRASNTKTTHTNNIYKVSGSSTINYTIGSTELTTAATIFTNTAPADPIAWNYVPISGSPAIDFGQNVGLAKDFMGNTVPAIPNAGILESGGSTPPPALTASSTAGTISCNGGTTTVTVSGSGGTPPYSGTGTFTVSAGTYTYTVTDAAGLSSSTSITINQPASVAITISAGSINVPGGTTNILVNASGGTGSYTYSLNAGNYQSSAAFSNVGAGNHSVNVKDANGCISLKNFTLTEPASNPLVASSGTGTISCNGGTATVTVTASGGTSPYTGTGTFTVSAGTYTYTVTDAAGAVKNTSITVTQPTAIAVTVSSGNITVFGGTTRITVSSSGGTGTHTYKLNNGSYQSSNIFNSVTAGSYTIRVKDANSCTEVRNITITEPTADPLIASSVAGSIACNGGTATVTVTATGGVAPYTGTGSFTVNAGTYNYTVTDANGTIAVTSVTITQPSAIAVTVSAGTINTFGGSTTVTASATGGTGAYSYKLNNNAYQSGNVFSNVQAGNHTITVKDANNCTMVKNFTLTQPANNPLIASSTAGTIDCNGGMTTITVSATGGTAPYTGTGSFTVSAGTYNYTVTDALGNTSVTTQTVNQPSAIVVTVSSGTILVFGGSATVTVNATGGSGVYTYKLNNSSYQSGNTFSNVAAGNHVITVKDANGCIAAKDLTLSQPANNTLIVSAAATPVSCYGNISTITVSASGGTAPYTGTGLFTGYAGTYNYTVTDANGVSATTSLTISQPEMITVNINSGTISAPGQTTTVTVNATGGTAPYTYNMNGAGYQLGNGFSNVSAGAHSITVKDSKGCTMVNSFTITQSGSSAFKITLLSKKDVVCRGGNSGSIEVIGSGGAAPYMYKLNNGRYVTSPVFTNLRAGIYRVNAKDAVGRIVSLVVFIFDGRSNCKSNTGGKTGVEISSYPNPSADKFTLTINSENEENVSVEVINLNGRKVYHETGSANKAYSFGESFISGTYFVRVIQGTTVKTMKIIKSK